MTATDIAALVSASIADRWSETNLHGVDLRERVLQTPKLIEAVEVMTEVLIPVWLVLTECGVGENGYGVAYSESDGAFGLVQFATGYEPCLLGIYGSFWETFAAM